LHEFQEEVVFGYKIGFAVDLEKQSLGSALTQKGGYYTLSRFFLRPLFS